MTDLASRLGVVVVDFNAGPVLAGAVASILADGAGDVVVVENGTTGSASAGLGALVEHCEIVSPGTNLGFGGGVNRGVAKLAPSIDVVVVANPDVAVHHGALREMVDALDAHPEWGIVGPTVLTETGSVYPSVRRFPNPVDGVGHALLGPFTQDNPFTRRYRSSAARIDGGVDWVSGSFFAIRRSAFEELGGFDERYFMFAEDMDLCFRAHERGIGVGVVPTAVVTHAEGMTRRAHPYQMLIAHHRSVLRFAATSTRGVARLALPIAGLVLGARLAVSIAALSVRRVVWRLAPWRKGSPQT
jgi:N-acetylglucosaminyl-diphospho-decaprenol L-rhamnosyltransferase